MILIRKLFTCLLTAILPLLSAVLRVPEDYARIQIALDSARNGDTVLVNGGIFNEHLLWPATPGIKLYGSLGSAKTILDAAGDTGSLCGIHTGVDSTTEIRGLTFKNARLESL